MRRRELFLAVWIAGPFLIVAAAAGWLYWTAQPIEDQDSFFGLWRMRHMLPAAFALWCAFGLAAWRRAPIRHAFLASTFIAAAAVVLLDIVGLVGLVKYPELFAPRPKALGIEAIPNLRIMGQTYQDTATAWHVEQGPIPFNFVTDRRGYRNEIDRAEADYYLLGDSILVAGLLPFQDTIAARIEDALKKPVVNIALLAVGPQQEREMLLNSGVPLEGRTVLHFVFEGNDLLDSANYREKSRNEGERGPLIRQLFSFQCLVFLQRITHPNRVDHSRQTGYINGQPYLFEWLDDSFKPCMDEVDHLFNAVLDIRKFVESSGGKYIAVYVPAKIRILGPFCTWHENSPLIHYENHINPLREKMTRWCSENHIVLIDTTQALLESVREGVIPWFWGDTHPNAAGHKAMAQAVLAGLATATP
jgi:hypothetical protein